MQLVAVLVGALLGTCDAIQRPAHGHGCIQPLLIADRKLAVLTPANVLLDVTRSTASEATVLLIFLQLSAQLIARIDESW